MRRWFYDHLASWAQNAANAVATPFLRLERWAYGRYRDERERRSR